MADGKCNKISMDTWGVMNALREYYFQALEVASARLIQIMATEIAISKAGETWQEDLQKSITVINREITDGEINFDVGAPLSSKVEDFIAAMIITYGAGAGVPGGQSIHEKPGQIVFDDNLGLHKSRAKYHADKTNLLPIPFNQVGYDWFENSMREVRTHFYDAIDSASANLPDSLFYDLVFSKG